jgi:hypothetical protein
MIYASGMKHRGRAVAQPMGRDNGHTAYLVVRQWPLAPRISQTTVAMSSDEFPRPHDVYASGHTKLTVGAPWLSPWARDNGSHTTTLVGETVLAPRISQTDRSNELRLVPLGPHDVYASGTRKLTVGAHCGSAHGARDNGSHTTYLVSEAMCFSPSYSRDRP